SRSDLRDQVKVITKCGIMMPCDNRPDYRLKSYDLSAEHIRKSVENSLSYLSVDRIDVLLLHRPDLLMDPEEIASEFEALKQAGKVAFFGVSNFTPSQFELLNSYTPLITNQIEASITQLAPFTDGTLDQCLKQKIRPMAWSPVGGGSLFKPSTDERLERIRQAAEQLAKKYGIQTDQLLLAWLLKHPSNMVPVLGTSKLERVVTALQALKVELTREDWYWLLQESVGHEVA
ncbi:MAG: aldo/keto reductase, partial [Bacteroidota bacterium]